MTPIQPGRFGHRHEELASIRSGPAFAIANRPAWSNWAARWAFVFEPIPRPAGSRPGRVPALDHESVDDPVEDGSRVKRLRLLEAVARVRPLFSSLSEAHEILDRLRRVVRHQGRGE